MLVDRDLENHDAVVLVLKNKEGDFLTLYHNKFDFWTVPLGKAEGNQTPEEAAAAEALEELGIQVTRLAKRYQATRIYCRQGNHIVTFFHVFEILEYEGSPENKEPNKHSAMKYLSAAQLRDLSRTSDGTIMLLALLDQIDQKQPNISFDQTILAETRVGLAGASGAGKTTFAKRLKDSHGATLHDGSVRNWLLKNGDLRYSALNDAQFAELQQSLLEGYERSTANVFDRCPLDSLYYSSRVLNLLDSDFKQRLLHLLRQYSAILFFPPRSDYLQVDGVRIADLKHQTEVAARMLVLAYDEGFSDKILIYDHCRTMDENLCELFSFLARDGVR